MADEFPPQICGQASLATDWEKSQRPGTAASSKAAVLVFPSSIFPRISWISIFGSSRFHKSERSLSTNRSTFIIYRTHKGFVIRRAFGLWEVARPGKDRLFATRTAPRKQGLYSVVMCGLDVRSHGITRT